METGGNGNELGIGDGRGLEVFSAGRSLTLSSLGFSGSALVDPVLPFSLFRGVDVPRAGAGVDRARCNWPGRDRGLVESSVEWPVVSMVRLRFRRRSFSELPGTCSLIGEMGDIG